MGWFQRIFTLDKKAEYIDQTPPEDRVTTRDLLKFMEKTHEQNTQLIAAVLNASNAQAETMKTYVELFKPKDVRSTTLEEREQAKAGLMKIRESEWSEIKSINDFNLMTAGPQVGIPPEPSEY